MKFPLFHHGSLAFQICNLCVCVCVFGLVEAALPCKLSLILLLLPGEKMGWKLKPWWNLHCVGIEIWYGWNWTRIQASWYCECKYGKNLPSPKGRRILWKFLVNPLIDMLVFEELCDFKQDTYIYTFIHNLYLRDCDGRTEVKQRFGKHAPMHRLAVVVLTAPQDKFYRGGIFRDPPIMGPPIHTIPILLP